MKIDRKSDQEAARASATDAKLSKAELLKALREVHVDLGKLFVPLEAEARKAAQDGDYAEHALLSRLAHTIGEAKHYLGGALDDAEARQSRQLASVTRR